MLFFILRQKKNIPLKVDLKNLLLILYALLFPFISLGQCPPSVPTGYPDTGGGPCALTLFAQDSDDDYRWYDAPTGGNLLGVGEQFNTPILSATTTYYVCSYLTALDCEGARIPVTATINIPPGDPNDFGNGVWNAYCYNDTLWGLYTGYYVDNNFNINSKALWDEWQSPFTTSDGVSGYGGGYVDSIRHSISYKKTNFPAGYYSIDIDHHDDYCYLYIDGVLVLGHKAHGHAHKNVWTGPLNNSSTVEFRWVDYQDVSIGQVTINPISLPTDLFTGKIADHPPICSGEDVAEMSVSHLIQPIHDSYVMDGGSSAVIHGITNPMELNTRTLPGGNQMIYLTFDISSVTSPVNSVKLKLLGFNKYNSVPNTYVTLHTVSDTTWNENTLTWNNKPAASVLPIDSAQLIDRGPYYYFYDVTNYIQSELSAGRHKVSFMIKSTVIWDFINNFYSKESPNPPMLVVNPSEGGCTFDSYQWQYQTGCAGLWNDIVGEDTTFYDPSTVLTQNTCYRLALTDICGNTAYSNVVIVNVSDPLPPVVTDATICPGSALLTATGSASTYNWYDVSTGGSPVGTGASFSTPSLSSNKSYFAASVDAAGCVGSVREQVDITLLPPSIAGTLSTGVSQFCYQPNSGTISLSGNSGNVTGWLTSSDNFNSSIVPLASTNTAEVFNNLTATTSYKTIVKNGTCPEDTTNSVTIRIDPITVGGSLHISDVTDEGGTIKLTNYIGDVARWEVSTDSFVVDSTTINVSSPEINFTNNSANPILYYRAVVQSGMCTEMHSEIIKIENVLTYTAFTPNGDGVNDLWIIDGIETYPDNYVNIFNRWGDLVFKQESYNNSDRVWDGYSNSGFTIGKNILPDGPYFYQISIGNKKLSTGYVVLKR